MSGSLSNQPAPGDARHRPHCFAAGCFSVLFPTEAVAVEFAREFVSLWNGPFGIETPKGAGTSFLNEIFEGYRPSVIRDQKPFHGEILAGADGRPCAVEFREGDFLDIPSVKDVVYTLSGEVLAASNRLYASIHSEIVETGLILPPRPLDPDDGPERI